MTRFQELDAAILKAIRDGKRDFTSIAYNAEISDLARTYASRSEPFRVVDRRLQSMRKRGLIAFKAKEWSVTA